MIDQHPFTYCHDPMRSIQAILVCHGMMSVAQPGLDRDEPSAPPDCPHQMDAPKCGETTNRPPGPKVGESLGKIPLLFPTLRQLVLGCLG